MSEDDTTTLERRGEARAGPGTVLVVDDSKAIRRILRRALEGAGYTVEEAADGEQGVAACRRVGPDLVLLDVDMPVMDGMASLAAMRADEVMASIPVLFLTALSGGADVALALDLGAQGYLRKPCEPVELVARVALALRTSERERALAAQARRAGIASTIDPLTGLGNRRFVKGLTIELTAKQGRDAAVGILFVDVDRFKTINDERGHPVGDSVLRILAGRLAAALGPGAWLARWGGEEFLVLVPERTGSPLAALGEQLRASVARTPFAVSPGVLVPVTVSVGCASGTLGAFEVVVEAADAAPYEAKRAGRNRVAVGAAS